MTKMKTEGVKTLVDEVLCALPRPLDEHVTLAVFKMIEANPKWLQQYRILCNELRQWVVNNWIGQWTRDALGTDRLKPGVDARSETTLIRTYSTLRVR